MSSSSSLSHREGQGEGGGGEEEEEDGGLDSFGTLAIRDDGAATFYGRSAGSEVRFFCVLCVGSLVLLLTLQHTCAHNTEFINREFISKTIS